MTVMKSSCAVAAGALFLFCVSVHAHHSFAAEFDAAKPVRLTGTVARLEWTNPHAHLHLDVSAPGGSTTSWSFELATPNVLRRGGWSSNAVLPGDRVTVNGYAAKDGSHFA